jgi:hypothetical protein
MSRRPVLNFVVTAMAVLALSDPATAGDQRNDVRALIAAPGVLEAILSSDAAEDPQLHKAKRLQQWERQLLAARVWFDIDAERNAMTLDVVQTGAISD